MALNNVLISQAKPKATGNLILKDERGLYMEVTPTGAKRWRLRYWIAGRENRISLGLYPDVSLKDARDRRDEARRMIAQGVDPIAARKAKALAGATYEQVCREWHGKFKGTWSEGHAYDILSRQERDIFPRIGARPIAGVTAPELLAAIRSIEARGCLELAKRALQVCGTVFRYAIATGRAERDVAADLRGAIPPAPHKSHAALTDPKAVAGLLRACDGYEGYFGTVCALKLAALTFVRPGELRHAEWSEIDLDKAEWRIPAEKMKMRSEHIVPLARQAVDILAELRPLTGHGRYVFPSIRTASRPMSENVLVSALRRMGYTAEEMTAHGFRSTASTMLHEAGWPSHVIEAQLAHAERNKVKAAYCRAEYMPERRKMMQAWADYLDGLRAGARVTPLRRVEGE